MNKDQTFTLVQRWRKLEAAQKDLDFQKSVLARDIRAQFAIGDVGDREFGKWCAAHLGLLPIAAKELLLRAIAAVIVPDEIAWSKIGGFKSVKQVVALPKREQVTTLQAARESGKSVRSVMLARGHIESPRVNYKHDAEAFARYLIGCGYKLPPEIKFLLGRYEAVSGRRLKAAA